MGFAIAVTAVSAADKSQFLANAGLTDSGAPDDENETLLSGVLWNDQYLAWRNLRRSKRLASPRYDLVSHGIKLLTLELHETSMGAQVYQFEDGKQLWVATGDEHGYLAEGPVSLDEPTLQDLCRAQTVAVFGAEKAAEYAAEDSDFTDPFSMVIELFVARTGFRYDSHDVTDFTALQGEMPFPKPWWKFW